jgi:hypothetical protein
MHVLYDCTLNQVVGTLKICPYTIIISLDKYLENIFIKL